MVEPARMLARLTAAAGQPTYAYRFSYVASSLRGTTKGALHATEIPFVFATVRAKYRARHDGRRTKRSRRPANAYWAAFAKTGDPNGAGGSVAGLPRRRGSWTSPRGPGPARSAQAARLRRPPDVVAAQAVTDGPGGEVHHPAALGPTSTRDATIAQDAVASAPAGRRRGSPRPSLAPQVRRAP